jgi:hypothetical protein
LRRSWEIFTEGNEGHEEKLNDERRKRGNAAGGTCTLLQQGVNRRGTAVLEISEFEISKAERLISAD